MEDREPQGFWEYMQAIDRRIIYTVIFILVAIILINPLGLPLTISGDSQEYYDYIDEVPEDGVLWLDTAYSPGSIGELEPMVVATLRHAFDNNINVVAMAMWEQGGKMFERAWRQVKDDYPDVAYGEDIVNLGYRPGGAQVILRSACKDVYETFGGVDHRGDSLDDMPLAMEVKKLDPDYVDRAVVYETGSPGGKYYVNYVYENNDLDVAVGIIKMSVQNAKPYYDAGQYKAILPGSTGAAEYEQLIGYPGEATISQDVLSAAMIFMVLLIILGNIGWLATREE